MQTKIILVDESDILQKDLAKRDCRVFKANTTQEVFQLGKSENPNVIIADSDFQALRVNDLVFEIRKNRFLRNTPLIMLSDFSHLENDIRSSNGAVDDYIVKPIQTDEVLTRIHSVVQKKEAALDANPLTKLPGNLCIIRELQKRLLLKNPFAVAFIDLDHFKAFNDYYGFMRGDQAITYTSQLLLEQLDAIGDEKDHFLGHIGGDDFVLISHHDLISNICHKFLDEFDQSIVNLYDKDDRKSKFIISKDRLGKEKKFPFLSVSIGIVSTENGNLDHYGKICQIGCELKNYAKQFKGSKIVKDQRTYD